MLAFANLMVLRAGGVLFVDTDGEIHLWNLRALGVANAVVKGRYQAMKEFLIQTAL